MVVGTWQVDYPMAKGMQRTKIRPMTIGAWCSGDKLDTEATHSYQQKMTTMQQKGIRSMAAGAQQTDSSLKAEPTTI